MYKLALCIPTYNRKSLLLQLLSEAVKQIRESKNEQLVQICISDNCSSDDTCTMVEELKKANPSVNIVFHQNETNIGADRNYLMCMGLADAEFCWIMGSDDNLYEDAISNALLKLSKNPTVDLLVVGREACTYDMKHMYFEHFCSNHLLDRCFHGDNAEEISCLFDGIDSTTGLFGYLTTLIIRKEKWMSVNNYEDFFDTAYVHTYIVVTLLLNGGTVIYSQGVLVKSRFGNDSFYNSLSQRIMTDIDGYGRIAKTIQNEKIREHFSASVRRHYCDVFLCMLALSDFENRHKKIEALQLLNYSKREINILKRKFKYPMCLKLVFYMLKLLIQNPVRWYRLVLVTLEKLKKR